MAVLGGKVSDFPMIHVSRFVLLSSISRRGSHISPGQDPGSKSGSGSVSAVQSDKDYRLQGLQPRPCAAAGAGGRARRTSLRRDCMRNHSSARSRKIHHGTSYRHIISAAPAWISPAWSPAPISSRSHMTHPVSPGSPHSPTKLTRTSPFALRMHSPSRSPPRNP